MSNRAWMPLHIGDYLKDTGHLTATEHGAYLLLIMHYWEHGRLPADERLIARIAKLDSSQWTESRDILAMLFGEGWSHKRIDLELAKAEEIIEKRRNAANERHGRTKADASAVHMQSKSSDTGALPRTNNLSSSLRSDDSAPAKPTPRQHLEAVIDSERAAAVIEHRQRIRKPLTAHAADLLARKLARCPDPNAAADAMVANGWQGFEPEWLEQRQQPRGSPSQRKPSISDLLRDMTTNSESPDHGDDPRNAPTALRLIPGFGRG